MIRNLYLLTLSVILAGSALAQSTSPSESELGVKSAQYIESLKLKGGPSPKKEESKPIESVTKKAEEPKDKQVVAKAEGGSVPKEKSVKKEKQHKPALQQATANSADSAKYLKEVAPEPIYAVYPELTAVYSKGGTYYVVIKLGNKSITAQDGEMTICGLVKVLSLTSVKVGAQMLYVN